MKKIIFLIILQLLLATNICISQVTFRKQIDVKNDDYGTFVCQTKDGGYIITGITNASQNHEDIVLVKTDMYGDTLWTKIYGGDGQEKSFCVQETFDNGFIVVGWTLSFGGYQGKALIIKTNEVGDTLWTRTYDGQLNHVTQTHDSCYLFVGINGTAIIRKLDNSGNLLWSKSYNFCKRFCQSIEIDENNLIVAGLSRLPDPPYSTTIDLLKADSNGDSIWFDQYGGVKIYEYLSIKQTYDRGFIMSATETMYFEYPNIYLQKVDSSGNFIWSKTFGDMYSFDYARSVVQTSDSGIVVTGDRDDLGLVLLKTDRAGEFIWEKGYDYDSMNTYGYCIQNTDDDHLIIVGEARTSFPPSQKDILLIKTDNEGLITKVTEHDIFFSKKEAILYPNPARDFMNVEFSQLYQSASFQLMDINGKTVLVKQLTANRQAVSISAIPAGAYVYRIFNNDGLDERGKVLVE